MCCFSKFFVVFKVFECGINVCVIFNRVFVDCIFVVVICDYIEDLFYLKFLNGFGYYGDLLCIGWVGVEEMVFWIWDVFKELCVLDGVVF